MENARQLSVFNMLTLFLRKETLQTPVLFGSLLLTQTIKYIHTTFGTSKNTLLTKWVKPGNFWHRSLNYLWMSHRCFRCSAPELRQPAAHVSACVQCSEHHGSSAAAAEGRATSSSSLHFTSHPAPTRVLFKEAVSGVAHKNPPQDMSKGCSPVRNGMSMLFSMAAFKRQ